VEVFKKSFLKIISVITKHGHCRVNVNKKAYFFISWFESVPTFT